MEDLMEKIVSLAKRRGFIYPGSELYGGLGGTWDYGPLGVEMKNNIKKAWWKSFVQERDDVVGLDSAIILNPKVWEASGHVSKFSDPMVDCKKCKKRYRADHLVEEVEKKKLSANEEEVLEEHNLSAHPEVIKDLNERLKGVECPACSGPLTEVRQFNLMFKTFVGPVEDSSSVAYLRPETAQGIFINFSNVLDSSRKKVPFGIAQIGKAFRNEVTPGNFLFRSREFEQMELEFFVRPDKGDDEEWFRYWRSKSFEWFTNHGIREEKLRFRDHEKDELSHYAKAATDIEYDFPFGGFNELEGVANRTDFDLKQHAKFSGKDLEYFDDRYYDKYIPYVIEPSVGVDRAFLAFLIDSFQEEKVGEGEKEETRVVLRLNPKIAPIKLAILPLTKDEKLIKLAKDLHTRYKTFWMVSYDEVASIGRRYRRQDEIGTPYCVTVDFDTLKDNAVTVRDRDSMKQERVKIKEIDSYLMTKIC